LLNLKKITSDFIFFGKIQKNRFREGRGRPVFTKENKRKKEPQRENCI